MRLTPIALLCLLPMLAVAGQRATPRSDIALGDELVMSTEGFASAHPDHRWRAAGQRALDEGRATEAVTLFRRSARYADKLSQAMLAELHWNGHGTKQDRAAAYAWMDLAAERGYRHLLVKREYYWSRLDEDERRRAIDIGERLYAEFGDDVAKPRMEAVLRRAAAQKTGTRLGADVNTKVYAPTFDNTLEANLAPALTGFYNRKFWDPALYWKWQDSVHGKPPRGEVEIRGIEPVDQPSQR